MSLNNGFMKLTNIQYTLDLNFNFINTIKIGKKGVEMWLQIINQPSQILHNRAIFGYVDIIDGQYIFWLKKTLKLLTIANSIDIQL